MSPDVVTLGEAMLRLSVPPGVRLETAGAFDVHVAGAELNTAIALASLGREVTWMSRLPEGPLGRRVLRELRANSVDTSHVVWDHDGRMGTYYVELAASPRGVSVVYDRRGSSASNMGVEHFSLDVLETARIAHFSGITPALSPKTRELVAAFADKARSSSCMLTVDVNYRAKLWETSEAARVLLELASGADLVVLTREDATDVFGWSGDAAAALGEARNAFGADAAVMTLGDQGAIWESGSATGRVPALPTTVVDRLGAGDAFMAGALEGLLIGDLGRGLEIGAALASLALGTNGDHVVTSVDEVQRLLGGSGRQVDR